MLKITHLFQSKYNKKCCGENYNENTLYFNNFLHYAFLALQCTGKEDINGANCSSIYPAAAQLAFSLHSHY